MLNRDEGDVAARLRQLHDEVHPPPRVESWLVECLAADDGAALYLLTPVPDVCPPVPIVVRVA